jgi:hypothetical protein
MKRKHEESNCQIYNQFNKITLKTQKLNLNHHLVNKEVLPQSEGKGPFLILEKSDLCKDQQGIR